MEFLSFRPVQPVVGDGIDYFRIYRRLVTVWMPYLFLSVGRQMAINMIFICTKWGECLLLPVGPAMLEAKEAPDRSAIILYATSAYWYSWWYGPHCRKASIHTICEAVYHPLDVTTGSEGQRSGQEMQTDIQPSHCNRVVFICFRSAVCLSKFRKMISGDLKPRVWAISPINSAIRALVPCPAPLNLRHIWTHRQLQPKPAMIRLPAGKNISSCCCT